MFGAGLEYLSIYCNDFEEYLTDEVIKSLKILKIKAISWKFWWPNVTRIGGYSTSGPPPASVSDILKMDALEMLQFLRDDITRQYNLLKIACRMKCGKYFYIKRVKCGGTILPRCDDDDLDLSGISGITGVAAGNFNKIIFPGDNSITSLHLTCFNTIVAPAPLREVHKVYISYDDEWEILAPHVPNIESLEIENCQFIVAIESPTLTKLKWVGGGELYLDCPRLQTLEIETLSSENFPEFIKNWTDRGDECQYIFVRRAPLPNLMPYSEKQYPVLEDDGYYSMHKYHVDNYKFQTLYKRFNDAGLIVELKNKQEENH